VATGGGVVARGGGVATGGGVVARGGGVATGGGVVAMGGGVVATEGGGTFTGGGGAALEEDDSSFTWVDCEDGRVLYVCVALRISGASGGSSTELLIFHGLCGRSTATTFMALLRVRQVRPWPFILHPIMRWKLRDEEDDAEEHRNFNKGASGFH
jgi:hypothetical protein